MLLLPLLAKRLLPLLALTKRVQGQYPMVKGKMALRMGMRKAQTTVEIGMLPLLY